MARLGLAISGDCRQATGMVKRATFLKLAIAIVALVVVGSTILVFQLRSYVSKDYFVELIEESINSRVEIGEVDFSWVNPTSIKIHQVRLAERDSLVEEKVAHDKRPKLKHSAIYLETLGLQVSLADIFERKVDVSEIFIAGADIELVMLKDGSMNLSHLFQKPEGEEDEETKSKKQKDSEKEEVKSFNAKDQSEFVTLLRRAEIKDSEVSIVIEESGLRVNVSGLNLLTKDIRVDPNALDTVNQASIELSGELAMHSQKGHQYGQIGFSGPMVVELFNAQTGEIEPEASVEFRLSSDSYLNPAIPVVQKVWSKLDVLEKVGLKVGEMPDRIHFGRQRQLSANYHQGLAELNADIALTVKGWEVAVLQGGWANIPQSKHTVKAELVAPKDHSEKLGGWIDDALAKVPGSSRQQVREDFFGEWFNGNEQMALQVSASGDLSKPKVKLANTLPDMKNILKTAGKETLKKELNKLLDDQGDPLKKEAGKLLRGLLK